MTMPPETPPSLLAQIQTAIRSVRFGSVQLTIHDGQVVQIEKRDKVRVTKDADLMTGGRSQPTPRLDRRTGERAVIGDGS